MAALSKSQIEKLGKRLAASNPPSAEDEALLEQVIRSHAAPLSEVIERVREVTGLEPTSRLKTRGTLIDKLRREKTNLSRMRDIAGCRVVLEPGRDLIDQQDVVDQLCEAFDPRPEVIDRRQKPSHGYRAVHVVAHAHGLPVEVQVRTEWQDLWAQVFDRLSDAWGRGIRYGEPPPDPDRATPAGSTRAITLQAVMELADIVGEAEAIASLRRLEAVRRRLLDVGVEWKGDVTQIGEAEAALSRLGVVVEGVLQELKTIDLQ